MSEWGIQDKELRQFQRDLKAFSRKEFAIINGMALNQTAFETSKKYKEVTKRNFTLRNKFTVSSIRFQKVKGFQNQFSEAGSIAPYMEDQEFGETKTKTGKKGVAIPTTSASNESLGARPRKRVVPRAKRRGSIRLFRSGVRSTSRKQHVVATVRAAAGQRGNTFVYLPRLGKMTQGIYRITGSKKKPKIRLIYDLSRTSVTIPRTPGLKVSVGKISREMPRFYKEAFEKRLKKSIALKSF